jgi:hypothetical protein
MRQLLVSSDKWYTATKSKNEQARNAYLNIGQDSWNILLTDLVTATTEHPSIRNNLGESGSQSNLEAKNKEATLDSSSRKKASRRRLLDIFFRICE